MLFFSAGDIRIKETYAQQADAVSITFKELGEDHAAGGGLDIAIDYGPDREIYNLKILAAREHLGFCSEKPEI